MIEVMKNKKDLESLKMSEDESITVYTLSVVVPSLFGGKRTTKSDIAYLPTYGNWRDKSLHTGLVYDLKKMLDPINQDIKLIISEQYQRHPSLKAMATETAFISVDFFSALVHLVDDTY